MTSFQTFPEWFLALTWSPRQTLRSVLLTGAWRRWVTISLGRHPFSPSWEPESCLKPNRAWPICKTHQEKKRGLRGADSDCDSGLSFASRGLRCQRTQPQGRLRDCELETRAWPSRPSEVRVAQGAEQMERTDTHGRERDRRQTDRQGGVQQSSQWAEEPLPV